MAKKKHKKKHNFKHSSPSVPAVAAPTAPVSASGKAVASKSTPQTMPNEWQDVRNDVRRSLILSGVFITGMIVLWFVIGR